jgi:hypothetical protein
MMTGLQRKSGMKTKGENQVAVDKTS